MSQNKDKSRSKDRTKDQDSSDKQFTSPSKADGADKQKAEKSVKKRPSNGKTNNGESVSPIKKSAKTIENELQEIEDEFNSSSHNKNNSSTESEPGKNPTAVIQTRSRSRGNFVSYAEQLTGSKDKKGRIKNVRCSKKQNADVIPSNSINTADDNQSQESQVISNQDGAVQTDGGTVQTVGEKSPNIVPEVNLISERSDDNTSWKRAKGKKKQVTPKGKKGHETESPDDSSSASESSDSTSSDSSDSDDSYYKRHSRSRKRKKYSRSKDKKKRYKRKKDKV